MNSKDETQTNKITILLIIKKFCGIQYLKLATKMFSITYSSSSTLMISWFKSRFITIVGFDRNINFILQTQGKRRKLPFSFFLLRHVEN